MDLGASSYKEPALGKSPRSKKFENRGAALGMGGFIPTTAEKAVGAKESKLISYGIAERLPAIIVGW